MKTTKTLRQRLLDELPGMPSLLNHPEIRSYRELYPTLFINDLVRRELDRARRYILESPDAALSQIELNTQEIIERALKGVRWAIAPSVGRAINAAGVILHTALGRAPLAETVQEAVNIALQGYCTLAIQRETGRRGDRHLHTEQLLSYLTGAESGLIVNNNAAGTMLILNTLAQGREVIVSRGQLVEIGGAFRIPDVLERSRCKLIEVGATNRTHLRDYENAISENTAILLRVHSSNFQIIGFTSEVPLRELAQLGKDRGIPVVDDLGSGALLDLSTFGLPKEPTVQESVQAGMDAVCFSGDKMLGGPQAGVIIGRREIIERIKRNPLTRALRCDKMTYAAMSATLKLYLEPEKLAQTHPVLRMITQAPATVKRRTQALLRRLKPSLLNQAALSVIATETEMGSGSLPGKSLPTYALKLTPLKHSADELAKALRLGDPPVFTRIEDDAVIFDLRTVFVAEEKPLGECIIAALKNTSA